MAPDKEASKLTGTNGAEGADPDTIILLQKFEVKATGSRRLLGVRDVTLMVVAFLPCVVLRATRYVCAWLGLAEHTWRGISNTVPLPADDKKKIEDAAKDLIAGSYSKRPDFPLESPVAPAHQVLLHLHCILSACSTTAGAYGLNFEGFAEADLHAHLGSFMKTLTLHDNICTQDTLKYMRKHGKKLMRKLAKTAITRPDTKEVVSHYMFHCLMQQSRTIPLRSQLTAIELADGSHLAEACTAIPLTPGIEYLRLQGDKYIDQVDFMTLFNRARPSDAKKQPEVQGMTINAKLHELGVQQKDGSFQPIYACPRSGAFAVHGRAPKGVGLSGLMTAYGTCQGLPKVQQQVLLESIGFSSLPQLLAEINDRKVLCMAQAIPVLVCSIQVMCRSRTCLEAAFKTGMFLHVQHSLLSDLQRHERGYLQDTKGALDILAEHVTIKFSSGSAKVLPLNINGSAITLNISSDCIPDDLLAPTIASAPNRTVAPSGSGSASSTPVGSDAGSGSGSGSGSCTKEDFVAQSYSLGVALFSQGINGMQSLGFLSWNGGELLQDKLNRQALEQLNNYATRSGRTAGPALHALNSHYRVDAERPPKDMEQFKLVRNACSEVGAGRSINCKSGKDRTALEAAGAFADEAVTAKLIPPAQRTLVRRKMLRGLSYQLTSQNNGQPPAFAFNEMELVSLPADWRPDWRLCGKVAS